MSLALFPTWNATLNALAGVFLILGWRAIRRGQPERHKRYMLSALTTSVLFLISYVTYHVLKAGAVTRYQGKGMARGIYFTILLTHTPLAALIVPLSIIAVWYAWRQQYPRHVRITRWLLPMWLYVSVTGVLIYLMLYVFPAGKA